MTKRVALVGFACAGLLLLAAGGLQAWNLDAKRVNALRFEKGGRILFTLFASGTSGSEFVCSGASVWFEIAPCSAGDPVCVSAVERMADLLLIAKTEQKPVHVQRTGCTVSEVALKPN